MPTFPLPSLRQTATPTPRPKAVTAAHALVACAVACAAAAAHAHLAPAASPLPAPDVAREERRFAAALPARYMEAGTCVDTTWAGWEGFRTKLCTYAVRDAASGSKRATVVLLDAPPARLARWVVAACQELRRPTSEACTGPIRRRIIEQSGAQFPIAGLVLEDMRPGRQQMYVFRDGVTCVVGGVRNGSTAVPTATEVERALHTPITGALKYARVAGTTREEYRGNGGTDMVGSTADRDPRWRLTVRRLYQAAWTSDRNELIVAWARANP